MISKEIDRQQAKVLIVETMLRHTAGDLPELKVDFPYYDYIEEIVQYLSKNELVGLSNSQLVLIEKAQWFDLSFDWAFRPIYKEYLMDALQYVTNEYLEKRLLEVAIKRRVSGAMEPAGQCPCCLYYSIDFGEDAYCAICPVCFWENAGSGPNHMSLEEAQKNFEEIGAIRASALQFVDQQGPYKYRKGI